MTPFFARKSALHIVVRTGVRAGAAVQTKKD